MHALQVSQDIGCEVKIPIFSCGRKLNEVNQAILWEICVRKQALSSRQVLMEARERIEFTGITVRHLNRLRVCWGVSRPKGRPRGTTKKSKKSQCGELVHVTPTLPSVGIHLFDLWLEQQNVFENVVTVLQQGISVYREKYLDKSFPLLSHRASTLRLRFKALFYAPLFDIGKLTQYDVKEHALASVIGRNYQSSSLNQTLGQLERIGAADYLVPLLADKQEGTISYIDGHMIPFWTSHKMHKGKITMLGRIMAGSQAVVAHNEQGQAIFFEYHPPDIRLGGIILDYCEKVVSSTSIKVFVIDREINSAKMGRVFHEHGLGLLSMLDKNEYKGLESFEAELLQVEADGRKLYEGQWSEVKKRLSDKRHFVMEVVGEKVSVFWGTKAVKQQLAPIKWPSVYRQRNEIQENSFKRMKAHGALEVNYGIKKIEGPDRHQERAKAKVTKKKAAASLKREKKVQLVEEQEQKVFESIERGHGKRLEQRQNNLGVYKKDLKKATDKENELQKQLEKFKEVKTRKDRNFCKQAIMTLRTLFLENLLRSFFGLVVPDDCHLSTDTLLSLLFRRSGGCLETPTECIYWVYSRGLSQAHKKVLEQLVQGLTQMQLVKNGKPVMIRVRDG